MATKACQNLSEVKARLMAMVQKGLEAYKLSKECLNQKIKYSTRAYVVRKDEVRSKVAAYFSDLDLAFLDEDLEDDKPTIEVEVATDPLAQTQ